MGLKVYVYKKNVETGEWGGTLDSEMGDSLAGSESTRTELWGSEIINSLGLKLLPTLTHKNIEVEGSEMLELEAEVNTVQDNVALIASNAPIDEYSILAITRNILKAIDRAKKIEGGVVIW